MPSFVVLMYHNLAADPATQYEVSPSSFRAQLRYLIDAGFVVEDFDGLAVRLGLGATPQKGRDGGGPSRVPGRYVVLSFDDGHESCLEAAEILDEFGLRATFFCCRDVSERADFLDAKGIRRLAETMSIGSHGLSHRGLRSLGSDAASEELSGSRDWLQDLLGRSVDHFSAPFGDIDSRLVQAAVETGYELVADSVEWRNTPASSARTRRVHRLAVDGRGGGRLELERFRAIVDQDLPYLLRRRARYEAVAGAKRLIPEGQVLRLARWKRSLLG